MNVLEQTCMNGTLGKHFISMGTRADVLENCTQITLRLVFRPEFRVVA